MTGRTRKPLPTPSGDNQPFMRALWFTLGLIVVDQITKTMVVLSMYKYQSIPILGDWFKFTFTTNPGMAFGIAFGPPGLVTGFAIIATFLIVFYMWQVRKNYFPYQASLALILGGAIGNIIDRVFYGEIYRGFGLFPSDGGFFTGEVVDFIHFDIWRGVISPPFGDPFFLSLFPIWNVADMGIVAGVVGILMFQKRFHAELSAGEEEEVVEVGADDSSPAPSAETTGNGHAGELTPPEEREGERRE